MLNNENATLTGSEAQSQKQQVCNIVNDAADKLRTDQVKIIAMKKSISAPDPYLRELARENKIMRFWEVAPDANGKKKRTTKTKFWCSLEYFENHVKPYLNKNYVY